MVKRLNIFWQLALGVLLLDQLTKWAVVVGLEEGLVINIIPGLLNLVHVRNSGAGFGILQGQNIFLILVSLIAIVAIIVSLRNILKEHHTTFAAALILGGAAGNLIDRLVYRAVIDFIDFQVWPAFNVADTALTIGVLWLLWKAVTEKEKRKKK